MRTLLILTLLAGAAHAAPSAHDGERWHSARVLYGFGGVVGLLGSGLTLASIVTVVVSDYPCDSFDPNQSCSNGKPAPKPTDPAPVLAYAGSTVSAFGWILEAGALGWEHMILREQGADPGRGVFNAGTTLGVLGFASVGLSYFFGLTSYLNPHDQGVAILSSSLTGAGLCILGGILYAADSAKMKRVWDRITTF
jgi:hypothetical protein